LCIRRDGADDLVKRLEDRSRELAANSCSHQEVQAKATADFFRIHREGRTDAKKNNVG
jgi:hypothetical protein